MGRPDCSLCRYDYRREVESPQPRCEPHHNAHHLTSEQRRGFENRAFGGDDVDKVEHKTQHEHVFRHAQHCSAQTVDRTQMERGEKVLGQMADDERADKHRDENQDIGQNGTRIGRARVGLHVGVCGKERIRRIAPQAAGHEAQQGTGDSSRCRSHSALQTTDGTQHK